MGGHLDTIVGLASANHGVISSRDLRLAGLPRTTQADWVATGRLIRLGVRSFTLPGTPDTWLRGLAAAEADLDGKGFLAGRTGAALLGLDGFAAGPIEVLAERRHRGLRADVRLSTTELPLGRGDTVIVHGVRCLTAERLILDAPLFEFSRREVENAIDSALRLRLVSEQRLRTKVVDRHRHGINYGRSLLDALVDTGGHSRLERWTLAIIRRAGLPRPMLQKVYRDGTRIVARVDFQLGDLVVEVCGHGTHSSRQQLQADEQRRTELTRRGLRVVVFRYEDVRDRPGWVADQLLGLVTPPLSARCTESRAS